MHNAQIKYLYQHVSPETAYIVTDYPWGFRLRTTIRYWIETKKTKNGGQRFGSQTINPKTGQWCAAKYSTYSPIIVMFLDEKNYVQSESLRFHDSEERILNFKEIHLDFLDQYQKDTLKEIIAFSKVIKNVTFTCKPSSIGPVSLTSNDPAEVEKRRLLRQESEKRKKEEKETFSKINRAISYEYSKVTL